MAANWNEAKPLITLHNEIRAAYPGRDTRSDGAIGDNAHAGRDSAHNPDLTDQRWVRARDFTSTRGGKQISGFAAAIVAAAKKHPAALLVIHSRRIWSRNHGWRERAYGGSNPHINHVHVSVLNNIEGSFSEQQLTDAATTTTSWGISSTPSTPTGGLTMSDIKSILEAIHAQSERVSVNTQILADLQERRSLETIVGVTAVLDGKLAGLRAAVEALQAGGVDDDAIARVELAATTGAESGTRAALEGLPHLDVDQAVSDALGQARIVIQD